MKLDQTAFICNTAEDAERLKRALGLENEKWILDTVTSRSIVHGKEGRNVAELQFNYTFGHELEILRYVDGPNWHDLNPLADTGKSFISHIGFHLEDNEDFPPMEGCELVQQTFTESHTAEYLTKEGSPGYGRKYEYRIYELSPGSYLKFIKRVHKEQK